VRARATTPLRSTPPQRADVPSPTAFSFEPLFLVLALAGAWVYLRAARRTAVPGRRVAAMAAGLFLIAASLNSPLETIAREYLLIFHLLQNVMLADWAPLLLIAGLTPRLRQQLTVRLGRPLAALTRFRIALPLWVVTWYVVHLGGIYDFALRHPILLNVEHAVMITIGLIFWWPVLSDEPFRRATLARLAYVFCAFVASSFLGIALTFAPSVYDWYATRPVRLWGISVDTDQGLGGVLMSSEQAAVFLGAIVILLLRLFREEAESELRLAERQRQAGLRH
jgi:cytochrome c oxidase assembly factor CtaG